MKVAIGRINGPSLDHEVEADFPETSLDLIKDVLTMVNKVSNDREKWYLRLDNGSAIIPRQNA